jgi:trigger factor
MRATLETGTNLDRRFIISLPMAPLEREIEARKRSLSVRSAGGEGQHNLLNLRDQIILGVKHTSFLEALSQYGLSSIDTPRFSAAVEEDGSLAFSVDFAVQPEIDTESYSDIRITRPVAEVSDQDIDVAIGEQYGSERTGDAELRLKIRGKLEYQLTEAIRQAIRPQIIEALLARHSFTPPEVMVNREFDNRMAQWRQRQAGKPMLKIPAEEQVRFNSSRAVSLAIIFRKIIQSANISDYVQRTRREIEHIASVQPNPEEVINRYYINAELLYQTEEKVKIDMAIEWVVNQATVVDTPSSFSQLVNRVN